MGGEWMRRGKERRGEEVGEEGEGRGGHSLLQLFFFNPVSSEGRY